LGIGDWGLGIGPNPQSPIPNPPSPIPHYKHLKINKKKLLYVEKEIMNKINKLYKTNYL
jgi:hypothetical protein